VVEVRVERREVCFRIAFLGRSGATKFANIRRLHEALAPRGPEDLTVMHAGGDRIVGFRLFDENEEPLLELKVGFQCVTMPGELKSPATERLLAASADAVVWLDDREGEDDGAPEELRRVLEKLEQDPIEEEGPPPPPRPVIVQCYSDDGADRATRYREALGGREARVRRIDSDDEGLAGIFDEACARVRESFTREQGDGGDAARGVLESRRRTPNRSRRRRGFSPASTRSLIARLTGLRADASAGRAALRRAELALIGALMALGLAGVALLVSLSI
jgi:hypothetical protein